VKEAEVQREEKQNAKDEAEPVPKIDLDRHYFCAVLNIGQLCSQLGLPPLSTVQQAGCRKPVLMHGHHWRLRVIPKPIVYGFAG
jgi:hypothetical protein